MQSPLDRGLVLTVPHGPRPVPAGKGQTLAHSGSQGSSQARAPRAGGRGIRRDAGARTRPGSGSKRLPDDGHGQFRDSESAFTFRVKFPVTVAVKVTMLNAPSQARKVARMMIEPQAEPPSQCAA